MYKPTGRGDIRTTASGYRKGLKRQWSKRQRRAAKTAARENPK